MNKAVFFDKDGVLNVDADFSLSKPALFDGVGDLIKYLRNKDFKIFIVTNQPIVARGIITIEQLTSQLSDFRHLLLEQNSGAVVDYIYYCPHHPNANIPEYRINCECRKPKPGMILRAADEYNVDLAESYIVGDRISDIVAGCLATCKTVLVKSGKHESGLIETDLNIDFSNFKPDYTINSTLDLHSIL